MELKEGVVARITKNDFPENIGKRVLLRTRPPMNILTEKGLSNIKGWLVWPIDDICVKTPDRDLTTTIFPGMQKTFLTHLVVKDEEIEALETDNDGSASYKFTQHPLDHLLNTGMDGHATD